MAEAFLNHLASEKGLSVQGLSAGTLGAGNLNPVAVAAMEEIGVPMGHHIPKQLTQELVAQSDKIISMGCGVDADACPAKFLVTEDWGLDDPAGQPIETVRRVRDEIRTKVEALVQDLANVSA
jgi:arsenate reductase